MSTKIYYQFFFFFFAIININISLKPSARFIKIKIKTHVINVNYNNNNKLSKSYNLNPTFDNMILQITFILGSFNEKIMCHIIVILRGPYSMQFTNMQLNPLITLYEKAFCS